jgi:hypothetical protein
MRWRHVLEGQKAYVLIHGVTQIVSPPPGSIVTFHSAPSNSSDHAPGQHAFQKALACPRSTSHRTARVGDD